MPVVALVGAATSIAAGVTVGATTLMGGLMVAGGALTAIGTITGNKKVAALGALIGVGAGIANAVSGTSSAASGASGAESASGLGEMVDATGGIETATNFGNPPNLASMANVETSGLGEAVDATGGMETAVDARTPELNLATAKPEDVTTAVRQANPQSKNATDFETGFEGQVKTEVKPEVAQDDYAKYEAKRNDQKSFDARNPVTGKAKGMMADVMEFIQNPKNAGALKVGGGLVAGAMKGISDQSLLKQKAALEEEIKARDRERLNKSITGMARFA